MVINHTHRGVCKPDSLNFYKTIGPPQEMDLNCLLNQEWYQNNESANKEMDLVRKKVYEWV